MPSPPNDYARARRLERAGDLAGALDAYGAALAVSPEDGEVIAALAGLAERMEMHPVALALWERLCLQQPGRLEAIVGRARMRGALGDYAGALGSLQAATSTWPDDYRLWGAMGVLASEQGESAAAVPLFDAALRLDPAAAVTLYNRGNALLDLGELDRAEADFAAAARAARKPSLSVAIALARAMLALCRSELGAGWDAYEARLSRDLPIAPIFKAPGKAWTPQAGLAGKHLLVVAEQGLGDEIMFANALPDALEALGPDGRLSLAVDARLIALFQRSFPRAQVVAHATVQAGARRLRSLAEPLHPAPALWAPMGSLLRRFRRRLDDFPSRPAYLAPDPARVAHWRAWLGDGPPAVGLSWRSAKMFGERRRHYPSPEALEPLLRTPGVRLVSLQYGDCAEELEAFGAVRGEPILRPPGLDIREDIDDLAALCVALDLVVSVPNATAALAGACGAKLIMLGAPFAWPRLGTGGYPWYPRALSFAAPAFGVWEPAIAQAAAEVAALAASV